MAKICDDFTYGGVQILKTLSLLSIDFNSDSDITLGLKRDIISGETNKYRNVKNHLGTKDTEPLSFEIDVVKSAALYNASPDVCEFSDTDIENVAGYLLNNNYPKQLIILDRNADNTYTAQKIGYYGIFTDIQTFVVSGRVMGLKLFFTCDSIYGKTYSVSRGDFGKYTAINSKKASLFINYETNLSAATTYPKITITSTSATTTVSDVIVANITDGVVLANGKITVGANNSETMTNLIAAIETYATNHGYTTSYTLDSSGNKVVSSEGILIRFKYVSISGKIIKCTAFFDATGNYYIFSRGLLYLSLKPSQSVVFDCDNLIISDTNNILNISDIGITDIDYMYWFRILPKKNTILVVGDATVTFIYDEFRKVGSV